MQFNEYQEKAAKTAIYPNEHKIIYPALGLAGEAGELCNKIKKILRDGFIPEAGDIAKELGDVLWYLANLASDFDIDFDEVAELNIAKLSDRAKRGVIGGSGDDR